MIELATNSALIFSALCGVILLIRNLHWLTARTLVALHEGHLAICIEAEAERCFPAWIVRIGTVLMALTAICAAVDMKMGMALCLALLLGWRWLYFAKDMKYSGASMAALLALAVLVALKQGGIVQ